MYVRVHAGPFVQFLKLIQSHSLRVVCFWFDCYERKIIIIITTKLNQCNGFDVGWMVLVHIRRHCMHTIYSYYAAADCCPFIFIYNIRRIQAVMHISFTVYKWENNNMNVRTYSHTAQTTSYEASFTYVYNKNEIIIYLIFFLCSFRRSRNDECFHME